MILQIQPNIDCENCIKCGKRPHIEQEKKFWIITCPDKACKNLVKDTFIDMKSWNRLNKNSKNISINQTFKRTA